MKPLHLTKASKYRRILITLGNYDAWVFGGDTLPKDACILSVIEKAKHAVIALGLVQDIDLVVTYSNVLTRMLRLASETLWTNGIRNGEDEDVIWAMANKVWEETLEAASLSAEMKVIVDTTYRCLNTEEEGYHNEL